jgi:hypothetical protein
MRLDCPVLMTGATDSQPTGARRPLVEVLVTPDCPHRDAAITLARLCEPLSGRAEIQVIQVPEPAGLPEEAWLRQALRNAETKP